MKPIFITILSFSNFDECWNHYHQHEALIAAHTNKAEEVCVLVEQELPPMTVLRPKARPAQD